VLLSFDGSDGHKMKFVVIVVCRRLYLDCLKDAELATTSQYKAKPWSSVATPSNQLKQ